MENYSKNKAAQIGGGDGKQPSKPSGATNHPEDKAVEEAAGRQLHSASVRKVNSSWARIRRIRARQTPQSPGGELSRMKILAGPSRESIPSTPSKETSRAQAENRGVSSEPKAEKELKKKALELREALTQQRRIQRKAVVKRSPKKIIVKRVRGGPLSIRKIASAGTDQILPVDDQTHGLPGGIIPRSITKIANEGTGQALAANEQTHLPQEIKRRSIIKIASEATGQNSAADEQIYLPQGIKRLEKDGKRKPSLRLHGKSKAKISNGKGAIESITANDLSMTR